MLGAADHAVPGMNSAADADKLERQAAVMSMVGARKKNQFDSLLHPAGAWLVMLVQCEKQPHVVNHVLLQPKHSLSKLLALLS